MANARNEIEQTDRRRLLSDENQELSKREMEDVKGGGVGGAVGGLEDLSLAVYWRTNYFEGRFLRAVDLSAEGGY